MEQYNYLNVMIPNTSIAPPPLPSYDRTLSDPRLNNSNILNFLPYPDILQQPPPPVPFLDDNANTQFINTWLMERGKFHINVIPKDIGKTYAKRSKYISINKARIALKNCMGIVKKMSETQEELRAHVETMSTNEWKQKTLEIGCLRDEFDKLMTKLEDSAALHMLKATLAKRAKKRLNQKKRKQFEREKVAEKYEKRLIRHNNIDKWLEKMKQETEQVKKEEKLKKDADCVLYEVCKKKADARKHLSLISALVKLRTVRDNMATQRGEKLSLEDRKAFGLVTEKLIRTWENCFQNYSKEEQNLRTMLEHNANVDSKATQLAKETNITEEWENVLFGEKPTVIHKNNPTYWALTSADRDMETFIAIRKSWDTFLTAGEGSSIPLGWVLPPLNATSNWSKYLS